MKNKVINVRVDENTLKMLLELSKSNNVSQSEIISVALEFMHDLTSPKKDKAYIEVRQQMIQCKYKQA